MAHEWPLIFSYHHVSERETSRYVVPVSLFESQLAAMLEAGYRALTLETALAAGPNGTGTAAPRTFSVTFDDGFESFSRLAVPALERLGLLRETTVFVPTRFVGGTNEWQAHPTPLQKLMPWSDVPEPLMSWDEIAHVAEKGVSVQSHGHAHLAMQGLTYEQALEDATTSKRLLADHGIDARYFALPFGWRSDHAKAAIRDAGFDAAVAVKWGGRDNYEVRRVPAYGTDGALIRRLKLSGRYFVGFDALGPLGRRGVSG